MAFAQASGDTHVHVLVQVAVFMLELCVSMMMECSAVYVVLMLHISETSGLTF